MAQAKRGNEARSLIGPVLMAVCAPFCYLPSAQAGAIAFNLLSNGDFESGSTSGWTVSSERFGNTAGSCLQTFAAQTNATGCVPGIAPAFGIYAAYASASFP